MHAQEILAAKRAAQKLTPSQIRHFIDGYTEGSIPDYQAAALVMAIAIHGMEPDELAVWTEAMLHSGEVLDLSGVEGVKVDKHSTGGVGDKISLCLAPMVAACGVPVPMISGRGLGHTGGTLDKLEAIPGFSVGLTTEQFIDQVGRLGVALIGQTETLAPADRKLYALRDVTATVDSIPLIASSIMSKKLAEGIDALVLDVKVGDGAFMKTLPEARTLAQTLVDIGSRAGKAVTAFLTSMDQVLGHQVGNANETAEAIEVVKGTGPKDVTELTLTLGCEMLVLGGVCEDTNEARRKLEQSVASGAAAQKLRSVIEAQRGDAAVVDDPGRLPTSSHQKKVPAQKDGHVAQMKSRSIGRAAMLLGAGRRKAEDSIDPGVGVEVTKKVGEPVNKGDTLAILRYNERDELDEAVALVENSFVVEEQAPPAQSLILEVIRGSRK
jgi:pyrimidine-nucleoside phosphorylase